MSQGPEKACFADKLSIYDSLPGDSAADKMEEGVLCLETMKFTSGQGLESLLTKTIEKSHEIWKPFARPTVLGLFSAGVWNLVSQFRHLRNYWPHFGF